MMREQRTHRRAPSRRGRVEPVIVSPLSLARTGRSPGEQLMRDPSAFLHALIHQCETVAATYGRDVVVLIVCTAIAAAGLRHLWWRRFHARLAEGARQITVMAPPEVDPKAAHEV